MSDARPDPEGDRAALILRVAAAGDRAAFAHLFSFYAPRVKSQAMRFGLSADAAEDVAQETLLSLWRRASQFDPARGPASAWVFAIAAHARIDRLRKDGRQPTSPIDEALSVAAPEQDAPGADVARLLAAVDALPDNQREILRLSIYRGATHGEIAQAIGAPLGTVKSRIRLAMGRLRLALGREE
jgi:RNA polymerase sigma-70 factor (ECF subfamily)